MSDEKRRVERPAAPSYSVGDKVTDPRHGFATVTFAGTDYIGLYFEETGQHALFRIDDHDLHPGWDAAVLAEQAVADAHQSLPWPDSTFVAEGPDAEHSMGSHWNPFHEDGARAFLERLPAILRDVAPLRGFGEVYECARAEPANWAKGLHLAWPEQLHRRGLIVTLRVADGACEVASLYPYVDDGVQVTVRLERVRVWARGVEAQIDGAWGDAAVTFFDTAFLSNRGWYEAGGEYEFLLAGIAYAARPAAAQRIAYTPNPEQIAWERTLARQRGEPPPELPAFIDLGGMAMFLNIPEWDVDDYSFRGPVKTVEPFDDFLGQAGWRVRVTVMRFDDKDADLDIYVTRRVWQGNEPPRIGQDVEGRLWLQGRLWSAPQAWDPGRRKT